MLGVGVQSADVEEDPTSSRPKLQKRSSVACLACRSSKLRCDFDDRRNQLGPLLGDVKCTRCERLGKDACVIIQGQRGRKTGSKNRTKEEKQADAELRAARAASKNARVQLTELDAPTLRPYTVEHPLPSPQAGPSRVMQYSPASLMPPVFSPHYMEGPSSTISSEGGSSPSQIMSGTGLPHTTSGSSGHSGYVGSRSPDDHALSHYRDEPPSFRLPVSQLPAGSSTLARLNLRVPQAQLQEGLDMLLQQSPSRIQPLDAEALFSAGKRLKPDVGHGIDPVEVGLLSEEQLARLFSHFFSPQGPHESAPTLDPDLHTTSYTRQRSALLTSTVALLAAQCLGGQAQLSRQLAEHVRYLRRLVSDRRCKSLEICQALQLLCIWPRCDVDEEEEDQGMALAQAAAIALDLGLDRVSEEEEQLPLPGNVQAIKEQRNRERMLITFYIWDRAMSINDGRRVFFGLSDDFIAPYLDRWASHPLAAACDQKLLQHAALRYEACAIRATVLRELASSSPTRVPSLLLELVRDKLGRQLQLFQNGLRPGAVSQRHTAHCLIVYQTVRASLYELGLPQTHYLRLAGDPVGDQLVEEARLACLDVCETVVLQSNVLLQLPSNLSTAVVHCALQVLDLHQNHASSAELASLIGLLAQVARFLEVSGTVPPHRAGPNAKYGQHLFAVLRQAAEPLFAAHSPIVEQPVSNWHYQLPSGLPGLSHWQHDAVHPSHSPRRHSDAPPWSESPYNTQTRI